MNDKKIIEKYKKMKKISTICDENSINYSNLIQGKSTKENENIVAKNIINEIIDFISSYYKKEI